MNHCFCRHYRFFTLYYSSLPQTGKSPVSGEVSFLILCAVILVPCTQEELNKCIHLQAHDNYKSLCLFIQWAFPACLLCVLTHISHCSWFSRHVGHTYAYCLQSTRPSKQSAQRWCLAFVITMIICHHYRSHHNWPWGRALCGHSKRWELPLQGYLATLL